MHERRRDGGDQSFNGGPAAIGTCQGLTSRAGNLSPMKTENTNDTDIYTSELFASHEMDSQTPFARWLEMMQIEIHRYCKNGYRAICREIWKEYNDFVEGVEDSKGNTVYRWQKWMGCFVETAGSPEAAARALALSLGFPLPEEVF